MPMQRVLPRVYIGDYLSSQDIKGLKENKITHIVCAMRQTYDPPLDIKLFQVPVDDTDKANIFKYFDLTHQFIKNALEQGQHHQHLSDCHGESDAHGDSRNGTEEANLRTVLGKHVTDDGWEDGKVEQEEDLVKEWDQEEGNRVLVHCQAGVSRSTTLLAAFLMKELMLNADTAVDYIARVRSIVQPSEFFIFQLEMYERCNCEVNPTKYPEYRHFLMNEMVSNRLGGGNQDSPLVLAYYPSPISSLYPSPSPSPSLTPIGSPSTVPGSLADPFHNLKMSSITAQRNGSRPTSRTNSLTSIASFSRRSSNLNESNPNPNQSQSQSQRGISDLEMARGVRKLLGLTSTSELHSPFSTSTLGSINPSSSSSSPSISSNFGNNFNLSSPTSLSSLRMSEVRESIKPFSSSSSSSPSRSHSQKRSSGSIPDCGDKTRQVSEQIPETKGSIGDFNVDSKSNLGLGLMPKRERITQKREQKLKPWQEERKRREEEEKKERERLEIENKQREDEKERIEKNKLYKVFVIRGRRIRCKKCRRELASRDNVLSHGQGQGQDAFAPRKRDMTKWREESEIVKRRQSQNVESSQPSSIVETLQGMEEINKHVIPVSGPTTPSGNATSGARQRPFLNTWNSNTSVKTVRDIQKDEEEERSSSSYDVTAPLASSSSSLDDGNTSTINVRNHTYLPSGLRLSVPTKVQETIQDKMNLEQQQSSKEKEKEEEEDNIPLLPTAKCTSYFVEPLSWMNSILKQGDMNGKLICPNPKCGSKLGNYDWAGLQCSCGSWVCPGFSISASKVDEVSPS